MFGFVFLIDEFDEEAMCRPETKEEWELGIICSWLEVEGFPTLPEEDVQELLQEVGSFFLSGTYMVFCSSCSFFYFPFYTSISVLLFQGLGMLKRASSLKEEAHTLEEEAQCLEMEGLGKVEATVAGSEAEGFYGLLRGAIAHSSISSASPHP